MFLNLWVWVGLAAVAFGVAAVVGRNTFALRRRLRDAEARAETLEAAREQAVAEAAARQEEAAAMERQLEAYRTQVVDHFSGTWDLMRALVLRHRADFEQLAEGESPPWGMALEEPARSATLPATSQSEDAGGKVPPEGQPPGPGGVATSTNIPGSAGSSSRQRSWTGS